MENRTKRPSRLYALAGRPEYPKTATQGAFQSGLFAMFLLFSVLVASTAFAQSANSVKPSTCLAIAQKHQNEILPRIIPASFASPLPLLLAQKSDYSVNIRYATHSTYRIESPQGIIAATDFAGSAGAGRLPDIVTMNHAHSTHFTLQPDPSIPHVLRGWTSSGEPAKHHLEVEDILVRNVTTDLYRSGVLVEASGNSIFIFEIAGLCIGHVGHLHHTLTPEHIAAIGRLDVLMIPVDGSMTMSIEGMSDLARQFRSSVILPMHWFSGMSLRRFIDDMQSSFAIDIRQTSDIDLALNTLPATPTVIVLQPELGTGFGYGWQDP